MQPSLAERVAVRVYGWRHTSDKAAFGGSLDAKRAEAFSTAIEQAVTDRAYAQRLAATAVQRGWGLSSVRALVRAMVATPQGPSVLGKSDVEQQRSTLDYFPLLGPGHCSVAFA